MQFRVLCLPFQHIAHMHTCRHSPACMHMHPRTRTFIRTRAHKHAHMHACSFIHAHVHTNSCTHVEELSTLAGVVQFSASPRCGSQGDKSGCRGCQVSTSPQPRMLFSNTLLVLEALHFLYLRAIPSTWDTLLRNCEGGKIPVPSLRLPHGKGTSSTYFFQDGCENYMRMREGGCIQ